MKSKEKKAWKDNPWVWVVCFDVLSTNGKPSSLESLSPSGEMSAGQRGILFSSDMVRSILDGRKTQTRRVVKLQVGYFLNLVNGKPQAVTKDLCPELQEDTYFHAICADGDRYIKSPYGKPGDILWVREKWHDASIGKKDGRDIIHYASEAGKLYNKQGAKWEPSIHMPKRAARIWLQITDIRVERLQEITEEDAKAEGVESKKSDISKETIAYLNYMTQSVFMKWLNNARASFITLWDSINDT